MLIKVIFGFSLRSLMTRWRIKNLASKERFYSMIPLEKSGNTPALRWTPEALSSAPTYIIGENIAKTSGLKADDKRYVLLTCI